MLRSSTHKFNSGRRCHSRCNTNLSLTPSDSTGNSGISHGEVTDSARIEENLLNLFVGEMVYFLKSEKQSRNDACGTGGR